MSAGIGPMYKTGSQQYVGGDLSMRGRVYANTLVGNVEFSPQ